MSVTHLPTPVGGPLPVVDAPTQAESASRRRGLIAVGIVAAAAIVALTVNASPGDASPATCRVADVMWPTELSATHAWPTGGQPATEHAFSSAGSAVPWASSGPTLPWPAEQSTVAICS